MYLLWLRVAAALYGVASITALPAVLHDRPRWQRVCLPAAILASLFHFVSITEMLSAAHRFTPIGMNEIQSLLGLSIGILFLLVWLRYRTISFSLFALPLAFLFSVIPAIGHDHYSFPSPVVRSGWIFVHVAALFAAYAALIFSLLASLLYIIQERRLKTKHGKPLVAWLPPLETMDQIAHTALVLGFHAMTIGLMAGSLIAQESVGPAYFRDPKVLLSFAMWLMYIVLLFVRRSQGLRGRRAIYLSSLVFLVMISVWAANGFSSVHRFPAP
jgi:ABC-type uncharacterized transport system permease subunit